MLSEFLTSKRAEIIGRTQVKVAARPAPRATEAELTFGIPLFLDQLIDTLSGSASLGDEMHASATQQGDDMLRQGFTVGQVVHGYGDVCQAVTELAFELDAPITVDEFHTLNRCLDNAIAHSVTEYGRLREQSLADTGTERLGALAHEMRNLLNAAMLSFGILKDGSVTIGGSTGAVLERSLKGLIHIIDRALAEVRLEAKLQPRETVLLAEFIEEMEITGVIEAKSREQQLTVDSVDYGIIVEVDRFLLAAAVANLLQNAFKFSHSGGHIRLRGYATTDRVFIDVEDECGGLPGGRTEELFQPFYQAGADHSGLGLGLSISRKAVESSGGELRVRDLPGQGCIFTVELPRKSTPAPPGAVRT